MIKQTPTSKQLKYAALLRTRPTMRRREIARLSGYSDNTQITCIEDHAIIKDAKKAIADAAADVGVTPVTMLKTLKRSMDRSIVDPSADASANAAVKIAGNLLGVDNAQNTQSPQVVNTHNTLIQILNNVSDSQGGDVDGDT